MAGITAQQYLISFLATLQGDKAVTRGLTRMERAIKKVSTQQGITTKSTKDMSKSFAGMAQRAMKTILIWTILRTVYMGLIRTVGDMIRANLDLEEGMARIRTVVRGSADEVNARMISIKNQILDTATSSRISIKELAEAYYFLQTASLTAEEASSAFKATTDAMVGTGVKAKEMARAIAGSYNTMGKYLGDNLTVTEKMTKIADVLTFTYATQDVEMRELIQGYSKLAPYATGLQDSFTDLVTTIGFLNTRMLRGGRTGRLMARSILQLTKNSKQLSSIFGITFDPNKPMSLLNTIGKINDRLQSTGKITYAQSQALQRIFATRGAVAPRLLLQDFNELAEALKRANEESGGFAEKMKEIRMGTITAQMSRMKNLLAVLANDFISGVYGVGDFAEALKSLNAGLNSTRDFFEGFGKSIGFLATNFSQLTLMIEAFVNTSKISTLDIANPMFFLIKRTKKLSEALKDIRDQDLGLVKWKDYVAQQEKAGKLAEKQKKERENIKRALKEFNQVNTEAVQQEKTSLDYLTKRLKIIGASDIKIAKVKLLQVQSLIEQGRLEANSVDLMKVQFGLQLALAKEKQKALQTTNNLNLAYLFGNKAERARNSRIREMLNMNKEDLSTLVQRSKYARKLLEQYQNLFQPSKLTFISEAVGEAFKLKAVIPEFKGASISEQFAGQFSPLAGEFADSWLNRMLNNLNTFQREWELLFPEEITKGAVTAGEKASKNITYEIKTDVGGIKVEMGEDFINSVGEEAKMKIIKALKEDERLQKIIGLKVSPHIEVE